MKAWFKYDLDDLNDDDLNINNSRDKQSNASDKSVNKAPNEPLLSTIFFICKLNKLNSFELLARFKKHDAKNRC